MIKSIRRTLTAAFAVLAIVLVGSTIWSLPALASHSVATDRGCGTDVTFYLGETVQINYYIPSTWWLLGQNWSLTVYDGSGNEVTRWTGWLPPFFYRRSSIYPTVTSNYNQGSWQAVLWTSWYGTTDCTFTTANLRASSTGTTDSYYLSSGQSHLHRLELSSGYNYTVTVVCGGADFDLYLYNRSMQQVDSQTGSGCTESISFYASDWLYFVRVKAYSGGAWYRLWVR